MLQGTVHGLWMQNFISKLGIVNSISKPLRIHCDNSVTVFFSKNYKYSNDVKHMELKYLTVKEEVQKPKSVNRTHKHTACDCRSID